MLQKTFVYDTSKGFSALLKQYYSEKLEMHHCTSKKSIKKYTASDFELCFFIVNDIDDIFLLSDIYFEIEHFFISTPKQYFLKKIETLKLDEIIMIDFNQSKKDMIKTIDFNLSHIMSNRASIKV